MTYWIRQGVQGSSASVEYSFRAENHQFDTLSVHNSNYLNPVTFEMCSFLSLMCAHSNMTRRINLIFTQKLVNKCRNTPAKLFCSKPFCYAILIGGGGTLIFFWVYINEILSRNAQNVKPEYIVHDKQKIHDRIRISEIFNDYFISIGASLGLNLNLFISISFHEIFKWKLLLFILSKSSY